MQLSSLTAKFVLQLKANYLFQYHSRL